MSERNIVSTIATALEARSANGRPPWLVGPGAHEIRSAQAMIRRLASRPPSFDGIPGSVYAREIQIPNTTRTEFRPAIPSTPAHLKTRRSSSLRLDPKAVALNALTAELTRRRRAVEPLLERLRAGVASPTERLRGRMLAREAESLLGGSNGTAITPDGADDQGLREDLLQATRSMLDHAVMPGAALQSSVLRIPEAAVHDFAEYRFLRDPSAGVGPDDRGDASAGASLQVFLAEVHDAISAVIEAFCVRDIQTGTYTSKSLIPMFPVFIETVYRLFLTTCAADLYELVATIVAGYANATTPREDVIAAFREWLRIVVVKASFDPESLDASFDAPEIWANAASQIETLFFQMFPDARVTTWIAGTTSEYPFTPFPTGLVNFGLRIVYRQEWRPLGTQPGEIVRTIPLGPKQTERVSTKLVTTERVTRTSETSTSTETSNETSTSAKDSDDVVREASSKANWHVDASASGGFLGWSASVSAGASMETASSSRETKSRLNETMQKAATRLTRNVKLVVSTEHTTTQELQRSSEIVNSNDELAVTYVYSKLQRQYEIVTQMAEVNSVVFVPERVPPASEITADWIRKYDWILAKALLDESFADDLAQIARDVADVDVDDPGNLFADAARGAQSAMVNYTSYRGGTLPDMFSAPHLTYERLLERKRAVAADKARRDQRAARLISHVRQNILHYMRAIWSAEDLDQRIRRYSRTLVPTRWDFVPADPTVTPAPGDYVAGEFVPDFGPDSMRPLSEIIHPAGPIGYAGNYAVFLMRADSELVNLNDALALTRAHYVRFAVTVEGPSTAFDASVEQPRHRDATYQLTYSGGTTWVAQHNGIAVSTSIAADGSVELDGLRIRFEPMPVTGSTFEVRAFATDELQDPEIYQLRRDHPLPRLADENAFFTPALLAEIAEYLPEVALLLPSDLSSGWDGLADDVKAAVRTSYHRFLLVRDHTTRFLMETNNLTLDIDVGGTPVLEDFKRLHRAIDVLKEFEEVYRRQLENVRRDQRIAQSDLADPDIENVTMVTLPAGVTPGISVTPAPTTTPP